MLDTLRTIETPEGVELTLRTAGIHARAWAWVLDCLIRGFGYMFVGGFLAGPVGDAGMGGFFLLVFLGEWFYPVFFEVWVNGATPGKRALGLRVVHDDGTPVGFGASSVRNLVRAVDFFPVCYLLGMVAMLVHPDSKRLGDIAAGTLVVYVDRYQSRRLLEDVEPYPPWTTLEPAEQRAIVEFAERRKEWTNARARELADIVQPLTRATGKESVERLLGMAASIREAR